MEFKYGMTQEEKDEKVRKTIRRQAKSLYKACNDAYKLNRCKGCDFKTSAGGCLLHSHPITWHDKFK